MRTSVALYVLSTVAITITNQAAVRRMHHPLEEKNFFRGPWRLLYDDVAAEALGIGREDTFNARNWKNQGRPLEHIWDDVFRKGRDNDWIFRDTYVPSDLKGRSNKGSRDMHFGTSDETSEVKDGDHVDRTHLIPVYEEIHDLSLETENWTPETSNVNEDEDNKSSSRQWPETGTSMSGDVSLEIDHEDRLWPQNNEEKLSQTNNWTPETNNKNVGEDNKLKSNQWSESPVSISEEVPPKIDHTLWPQNNNEKPRQTSNWTSETNNRNMDEDNKLKSKQISVTRDNISGKVPLKIDHEVRLWPQNKDEKPRQTNNWTSKTNNRNTDEDNTLKSKQTSVTRDNISGKVPPKIDHEDRLWPQNKDEKPRQTNNWTSKTNNRNTHEDNKLKAKQRSVTRDNISGKVPPKIDHEHRLWPQNKDEKPSTVNPLGKRKVNQWPNKHSYVQKGNDYWYVSDAHPGVAFVLSGISLAGQHVGLFGGEWIQNTATGEMGDGLPWEQNVKSRNAPHERPEDISLTTRKSKLGIEGERTAEEVLTPDHSHHSVS